MDALWPSPLSLTDIVAVLGFLVALEIVARGYGELEADERQRILELAAAVHLAGRELRFWGAPDRPEAWALLRELGVDRLGTDRPKAAAAWLAGAAR